MLAELESAARALLGASVRVGARALADPIPPLPEAEAKAVAGAIDKRRREFAHGRVLARRLLAELGRPTEAIVRLPNRAPGWPPGVSGTLTHTDDVVMAAVELDRGRGLGLDLEAADPLDPALVPLILHPGERDGPAALDGQLAKVVFSAKEAFYKAQHRHTGTLLDFKHVRLELDRAARRFTVVEVDHPRAARLPAAMGGGWAAAGRFILTAATTQPASSDAGTPSR